MKNQDSTNLSSSVVGVIQDELTQYELAMVQPSGSEALLRAKQEWDARSVDHVRTLLKEIERIHRMWEMDAKSLIESDIENEMLRDKLDRF